MEHVLTQLLSFAPVVLLLVLVPGANNLHVLRTAAEVNDEAARAATAGTSAGIAAWSLAVALGVGSLVSDIPGGLDTLRVLGSGAMVAMGLWALVPRRTTRTIALTSSGFVSGLAVCITNPRTPLTAVSLLPQFALADASAVSTLALGLEWAAVAGLWNLACLRVASGRIDGARGRLITRLGGLTVCGIGVVGLVA